MRVFVVSRDLHWSECPRSRTLAARVLDQRLAILLLEVPHRRAGTHRLRFARLAYSGTVRLFGRALEAA